MFKENLVTCIALIDNPQNSINVPLHVLYFLETITNKIQ